LVGAVKFAATEILFPCTVFKILNDHCDVMLGVEEKPMSVVWGTAQFKTFCGTRIESIDGGNALFNTVKGMRVIQPLGPISFTTAVQVPALVSVYTFTVDKFAESIELVGGPSNV